MLVVLAGHLLVAGEWGTPGSSFGAAAASAEASAAGTSPQVVAWLQASVVPFASLDLGCGCDDLRPLMDGLGEARIVGLGEATHGTSEFHLFRARLVECLAAERGFTLLAMESGWSEVEAVATSLRTAEGDPAEWLYLLDWYNTEEILSLFEWVQRRNQEPGVAPVSVVGLDMQYQASLIDGLLTYVAEAQPADLDAVRRDLEYFRRYVHNPQTELRAPLYSSAGAEVRERCVGGLLSIRDRLVSSRQAYETASGLEAFARALRTIDLMRQAEQLFGEPALGNQIALRDRFMAENAAWLLEQAEPEAKMIVWAHNGHVSAEANVLSAEDVELFGDPAGTEWLSLGGHLKAMYGEAYMAVGFAFHHGSFNAHGLDTTTGAMTWRRAFTLEAPAPGSFEATLTLAGIPRFYLDLRRAAAAPDVGAWFSAPHRITSFGAAYITNDPLSNAGEIVLPAAYDVLVYFDATTPSALRSPWGRQ